MYKIYHKISLSNRADKMSSYRQFMDSLLLVDLDLSLRFVFFSVSQSNIFHSLRASSAPSDTTVLPSGDMANCSTRSWENSQVRGLHCSRDGEVWCLTLNLQLVADRRSSRHEFYLKSMTNLCFPSFYAIPGKNISKSCRL